MSSENDPISIAQSCLYEGTESLFKVFPLAIKRIINGKMWEGRLDKNGKPFASFEKFALAPLWHGLEIKSMDILKGYVLEDAEVVKMVEREMEGLADAHSRPMNKHASKDNIPVDNVKPDIEQRGGNKAEYLLRRLKRDAPDLAEDYIEGKYKSVRAAAIAAGIVKVQSSYEVAAKQLPKLNRLELMDLQARITALLQES